jgi:hypothetical protein
MAERPSASERRTSVSLARLATVFLAVGLFLGAPGAGAAEPVTAQEAPAPASLPVEAAPAVRVTIDRAAAGHPVPARFLGLSFEAAALGELAHDGAQGNLVGLLRSLGPGVLRFGGVTADENVAWSDPATPPAAWASSVIGPADMRALGVLARRSGWSVLLTVGMAHYEPQSAAREVAAAHGALGPYLAAVEIGNEPNSYGSHGFREGPWGSQGYEEQVAGYREAIGRLTPGIKIAGPDVSGSGIFPDWGFTEALSQAPALLTGHHYPLGCSNIPPPSIQSLLSPAIRGLEARSLATYLSVAGPAKIPFRLDEANSVSCGGVPGISNTFASALWASAYITQAMAAGTVGINLQGNPDNCPGYTPLCATAPATAAVGALTARPDWYALQLTHTLIGDRPLLSEIASPPVPDPPLNLVVGAFSAPGHIMKLVLVDDEPPAAAPLSLQIAVGTGLRRGAVLRLTGPSPQATSGVMLGGHAVSADGSLRSPAHVERAVVDGGELTVPIASSSAALVTLEPPAPHKQRRRRH